MFAWHTWSPGFGLWHCWRTENLTMHFNLLSRSSVPWSLPQKSSTALSVPWHLPLTLLVTSYKMGLCLWKALWVCLQTLGFRPALLLLIHVVLRLENINRKWVRQPEPVWIRGGKKPKLAQKGSDLPTWVDEELTNKKRNWGFKIIIGADLSPEDRCFQGSRASEKLIVRG